MSNNPEAIIIHHSATKDGLVLSNFEAIRDYHVNVLGWNNIGYNWVLESVDNELVWREGRSEEIDGAHTKGMNDKSIGLCIVGNFSKDHLTYDHYRMLDTKIAELDARYGELPIRGHSYYSNTECPGKNIDLDEVIKFARLESIINTYKDIIQSYCKFSAPQGVWAMMDKHPYSYDLYKKWALSYDGLVKGMS